MLPFQIKASIHKTAIRDGQGQWTEGEPNQNAKFPQKIIWIKSAGLEHSKEFLLVYFFRNENELK
jgi:hypothetical protein